METLVIQQVKEAPEHPVLPRAARYDVCELRLHWSGDTVVLEIEASTHEDYAVLRFEGVEELCVPCGDVITSIRLHIQDTSQCPSRTHHILPVRVGGTVDEGYSLRFWAQSVTRLTKDEI
jgi:hypothetical protein